MNQKLPLTDNNPEWIEDAKTETPTEQMDRIVLAVNRFEMVNCLITLLGKECGLGPDAELRDIMTEATKIYQDYYNAQQEFRAIKGLNIKR